MIEANASLRTLVHRNTEQAYWEYVKARLPSHTARSVTLYCNASTRFAILEGTAHGPAMAKQTTSEDTHPARNERRAAIGEEPSFSPPEPKLLTDCWAVPWRGLPRR